MKRIISLILSISIAFCMTVPALSYNDEANRAADELHKFGLFSGTGIDSNGNPIYDLDKEPTREQAITMLVCLLGKASEAKSGKYKAPFSDVSAWAQPYVGYAYSKGLTAGMSKGTFGGAKLVLPSQYITFVLRALGYSPDSDFKWDSAWGLSDSIGLTDGRYNSNKETFSRGDVAIISRNALSVKIKNSENTLLKKLGSEGMCSIDAKRSLGTRYLLKDGNCCEFSRVTSALYYTIAGTEELYIPTIDMMSFIVAATGSYTVDGGKIKPQLNSAQFRIKDSLGNDRTVSGTTVNGIDTVNWTENTDTWTYNFMRLAPNGKLDDNNSNIEFSGRINHGTHEVLFYQNGCRYVAISSAYYINAGDLFSFFNLNVKLSYVELSNGDHAWTITAKS